VSLGALLTIGGSLAALVFGVWLGLPGRYTQSTEEIEESMERGGGPRRTVRRVFTPLAWLMRRTAVTTARRHRRFKLQPPRAR
jgi:hypothetical protein